MVGAVLAEMAAFLGLPVGLLLGLVIHRGDFCMHSAVREVIAGNRERQIRAYLLALGFLLIPVNALAASPVLTLSLPPVTPAASIAGGLIFGLGMVMAKGLSDIDLVPGRGRQLGRGCGSLRSRVGSRRPAPVCPLRSRRS
jgi:uncharacterized membrane protein YedE/YeeE